MRALPLAACLAVLGCECGGVTLRLSGPDVMLRTGTARFVVSVIDEEARPGEGQVRVSSDLGSLREGAAVTLDRAGAATVEFSCAPSDDPACAGDVAVLEASWRRQRVERRVRLVDELPVNNTGGGSATGGGSTGGGSTGGGSTGGGSSGSFDGGSSIADGGACTPGANLSSLGCEFLVAPVPPEVATEGSCYAVVLANGGAETVEVRVERGGLALFPFSYAFLLRGADGGQPSYTSLQSQGSAALLPSNEVAVLFLARETGAGGTACPRAAAVSQPFQVTGPAVLDAFRITTSGPVAAYDIYPYGGAPSHVTSASLLLPTTAWATTSVGLTPAPPTGPYNPFLQIFATEDLTMTFIESPVAIVGGGPVVGSPARQVVGRLLRRGEVLQLQQAEQLGGAVVRSSRPVAVWGGHACMYLPNPVPACDSAHQQLPPVRHLGSEYVAVRPPSRASTGEDALWRFAGTTAATLLTYTPPVQGAPTRLDPGQVVEFWAPGPFVVRAQDQQHPFLATQLMRGGQSVGGLGDPEFVLLVPPGQFLSSYLFFTDHTYANTHLVFTRRQTMNGTFEAVTLDCGAPLSWQPTGDPRFQYAIRSWRRGESGGCTNGIRRASSPEPFGLTVWGTDSWVSYAYPAGMGVAELNTIDPDPIQ
ncbi:MAG: IgGFc-binding protein [Myxococcaceae bacterium]|nr:IgGFc-binding protein [Myxococcaceae bacterium]